MAIADADIRRVREATDLVAVVSESVALRRVGRRWVGLCPFHEERTPSFTVNPELGVYYCFGCHARGDAITFVRELERLEFTEAVERLAARAGIQLHYEAADDARAGSREAFALLDAQARWYAAALEHPEAEQARDYLRERGIDEAQWRRFGLGWAPRGRSATLRELGGTAAVAIEVGIRARGHDGSLYDPMAGRIIFPIRDPSGRTIGFGGRTLVPSSEGVAKYRNTPDTPYYHKRSVLYNLDRARHVFLKEGCAVVCEGYTDVIGLDAAGIAAVATCGTALTDDHLRLLRRYVQRVVVLFDGDEAGRRAAEQVGLSAHVVDLDVLVGLLPAGLDPADAVRADAELVRRAIEDATPLLRFRLERTLSRAELRTPEGRARAAGEALSLLGSVREPLVRSEYLAIVAERTGFRESDLAARLPRGGRARPAVRLDDPTLDRPAAAALACLAADPSVRDVVVPALFRDPLYRELAEALHARGTAPLADVLDGLDGDVRELYHRIAASGLDGAVDEAVLVLVVREAEVELRREATELASLAPHERGLRHARWLERMQQLHSLRDQMGDLETAGALLQYLVEARSVSTEGSSP